MPILLLALLGLVVFAVAIPSSADAYDPGPLPDPASPDPAPADPVEQLPGVIDETNAAFSNAIDAISGAGDSVNADLNVAAFLRAIRFAEGTAGPNGYRTLFGGSTFSSFADHPRTPITATSNGRPITSTAAGAYQILARTYDATAPGLGISDFSPAAQDAIAVELIRKRGALGDVQAGNFDKAIGKVRGVWASLPGAGYGQPERTLVALRDAYTNAGGSIA